MAGAKHRRKGDAIEREIVAKHKSIGVHAERYPLSGATRFRGSGHDIDIYPDGREEAPLVAEVKGRKGGAGFTLLEKWLGEYDVLFLRRNNADPLVVVPWHIWSRLLHGKNSRGSGGVHVKSYTLHGSDYPDGVIESDGAE
jgi:Holliday junction resolvase